MALFVPSAVCAYTRGVALAVNLEKAPVVDGDLSEWRAPFVHLSTQTPSWFLGKSRCYGSAPKSPQDLEAWFALSWQGDKLFLAAAVLDDVLVKNHDKDLRGAWQKDSVEVFLSLGHDASRFSENRMSPYRAGDFQVRLVPFEREKGIVGGIYLQSHGTGVDGDKFSRGVKCVTSPYSKAGRQGYLVEASFDLAELGFPGALKGGKVLGFDLAVNDADSENGRDRLLTWSSFNNRGYQDASSFGDLVLADRDGKLDFLAMNGSKEKKGYFLLPGGPELQKVEDALSNPEPDDASGRVLYATTPPQDGKNISRLFDPNPYRPIRAPTIRYCQLGYLPGGKKMAYLELPFGQKPSSQDFVLQKGDKEVLRAPLRFWGTLWRRDYYLLDFQACREEGKDFVLAVGGLSTDPFPIHDGIYDPLAPLTLGGYFYAQRCGQDCPPFHKACHLDDAVQAKSGEKRSEQVLLQFPPVLKPGAHKDVTGGWHDAGDFGKYMGNTPFALDLFLLIEEQFHPKLDSNKNGKGDFVDEVEYGSDWCLKMQDKDGGVFERVWNGFGAPGQPELDKDPRLLDSDKWANVTGRWVSTAAFGAQVLEKSDPAYAAKLKKSALLGWDYIEHCPKQPRQPWAFGVYPGNDSSIFWAAVELYRLTKEKKFLRATLKRLPPMLSAKLMSLGWSGNNTMALLRLYPVLPEGVEKTKIRKKLLDYEDFLEKEEAKDPFGIRYQAITGWGNTGWVVMTAVERDLLEKILPQTKSGAKLDSYRQWLYGANPVGTSFVVGVGTKTVEHPYTQMPNMPGAVAPGIIDDGTGLPYYLDSQDSFVTNECGLDTTAANLYLALARDPWWGDPSLQSEDDRKKESALMVDEPGKPDPTPGKK